MNQVNSRNAFGHNDSNINIVEVIKSINIIIITTGRLLHLTQQLGWVHTSQRPSSSYTCTRSSGVNIMPPYNEPLQLLEG